MYIYIYIVRVYIGYYKFNIKIVNRNLVNQQNINIENREHFRNPNIYFIKLTIHKHKQ